MAAVAPQQRQHREDIRPEWCNPLRQEGWAGVQVDLCRLSNCDSASQHVRARPVADHDASGR